MEKLAEYKKKLKELQDRKSYLEDNMESIPESLLDSIDSLAQTISDIEATSRKESKMKNTVKSLQEVKQLLGEDAFEPTQQDAEALVELTNALSTVYVGGSSEVRKLMYTIDGLRLNLWNKVFSDSSKWGVKRVGNKLSVVYKQR